MTQYSVNRQRWSKLTIFEQLGNIGSEVGRAFQAKRAGRIDDSEQAMIRALDLFDATTEHLVRAHSARTKEILRARGQFLEVLHREPFDEKEAAPLDRYFLQFAYAARRNR